MVKKFKDPYTTLYASFAQSAIPVLPEVVADPSNDLLFIDIYEEENLKDLNNIYIGYMTKQFAGEINLIGTERYNLIDTEISQ